MAGAVHAPGRSQSKAIVWLRRGWRAAQSPLVAFAWLRRLWTRALRNNAGIASAAIAFFGLLGLVPAITAIGLLCGQLAAPRDVLHAFAQFAIFLPQQAGAFVLKQLALVLVNGTRTGAWGLTVAVVLGLYGLMNAAQAMITGLNLAYRLPETRGFFHQTGVALLIGAGMALSTIVVIAVLLVVGALGQFFDQVQSLVMAVVIGMTLILSVWLMAQVYRHAPCRSDTTSHPVFPGALVAVAGGAAVSAGFGFYAAHLGNFAATYGLLAGVAPIMLWFQLCAYAVLLGAGVNASLKPEEAGPTHEPALPNAAAG